MSSCPARLLRRAGVVAVNQSYEVELAPYEPD